MRKEIGIGTRSIALALLAIFVVSTAAVAFAEGTDESNTGSVRGLVFNDLNGNGIQDPEDPMVPGWWVYIIGPMGTIRQQTGPTGGYWFQGLPDGRYLICENLVEGWTQTYPQSSIKCPNGAMGWVGYISNGSQVIRVHFGNHQDENAYVTRTQGFWSTHTQFTSDMFAQYLNGHMMVGDMNHMRHVTNGSGDANSTLFGAYYSSVSKMSGGENRTDVDHARMVLLQQLVTAKINCGVFDCPLATKNTITHADHVYAIGDISEMLTDSNKLDTYNNSGDALPIPPQYGNQGSATPALSKQKANIVFWDFP